MIKAKQAKIWCAGTCPPLVILGNPKAINDWACVKMQTFSPFLPQQTDRGE